MDNRDINYRAEFLRSTPHIWMGILTLGTGIVSGDWRWLIAGVTTYALGWIYVPDFGIFKRTVDRRHEAARLALLQMQADEFMRRRETILNNLSPSRKNRYYALAEVCHSIETATGEHVQQDPISRDSRLRKLEELMWTFLRLLSIEESLERFLETERREDVPNLLKTAERECRELTEEIAERKKKNDPAVTTRERLLESRRERQAVLEKRGDRIGQAQANSELVLSEQDRLEQQIKLIRADAIATRNADALSARIDATVNQLDETNKWLSKMDEFKDLVVDTPPPEVRIGFMRPITILAPPPLPPSAMPNKIKMKMR